MKKYYIIMKPVKDYQLRVFLADTEDDAISMAIRLLDVIEPSYYPHQSNDVELYTDDDFIPITEETLDEYENEEWKNNFERLIKQMSDVGATVSFKTKMDGELFDYCLSNIDYSTFNGISTGIVKFEVSKLTKKQARDIAQSFGKSAFKEITVTYKK